MITGAHRILCGQDAEATRAFLRESGPVPPSQAMQ